MPKSPFKGGAGATGMAAQHLPPGAATAEIMTLIRLGQKFRSQHAGKRPGPLAHLIVDCVRRDGPPHTFARLLDALELAAARREMHGEASSPVEKIDRIWALATIHLPRRGRVQVPFRTLQNYLTAAKKILRAEIILIPVSPKP